ncbi:bacteriorhodopsin [Parvularcula dongshanensis]|uniref:Bacteriorhodopsin n=1 Tax=Parvularcula dongshanensis TaxID=1173995 RepID=A0A840I0A9_9PROT|nr:bacteriorhodopsin [Parvularcula dongshanensis]MBB4657684.1 bacteriorhodopsin [Parvularcula dongshanensis]
MEALHQNIENFANLSHPQYQLVAVLLMIGYGAHFAFSVFFLAASTQIAPRYRLVPWLSAVIMLAAGLSLLREYIAWSDSFTWVGTQWMPAADTVFSNAYRYANWTITIPLLLAQLLIALNLPQRTIHKRFAALVVAAIAMIWTGLIGQFFEHSNVGTMLLWGFISTIPFVYLVWGVWKSLRESRAHTPPQLHGWLHNLFFYFLFFWGLYALAYMVPAVGTDGDAIVVRQFMYTVADIFSKLVYGVILSRFVLRRSALEGYDGAVKALASWAGLTGSASGEPLDETPSSPQAKEL